MTIRLLIVDDHELVREGLRMTFEGTDVEVVEEAADGLEAFETARRHPIDVALVDIRMPKADGFQFLKLLQDAGMKLPVVLMHSVDDGTKSVRRCREMGAMGLVPKGQEKEVLLNAVHQVHNGEQLWDRDDQRET
jgi:DNA-binding NarL/FixJ family response regulator